MLPQPRRLTSQRDFEAFRRGSQSRRGPHLDVRMRTNNTTQPRFGFIVSKRVAKLATRRNQLKRRLRHIAAKFPPQTLAGYDILVVAKPSATKQSSPNLYHELLSLLTPRTRAVRSR